MGYFKDNAHRLFEAHYIEHAEELGPEDFSRAADMITEGMEFGRVLNYVRGWAQDYAYERNAESMAALHFEDMAYGRD